MRDEGYAGFVMMRLHKCGLSVCHNRNPASIIKIKLVQLDKIIKYQRCIS